jgi:hypothetical protein
LGLRIALALIAFATTAALLLASDAPDRARAAPCPIPTYGLSAGDFTLQGTDPCGDEDEVFRVFCSSGQLNFDYTVNGALQGTTNTGFACSAPTHLTVNGRYGGDDLDLSGVSAAAGFTGISQPNLVEGGPGKDLVIGSGLPDHVLGGAGSDTLLLRDGAPDVADCGDGVDAAQTDSLAVDAATNCEIMDVAATATPAKRKCKKRTKKGRAAAKKCKKKKKKRKKRKK